MQLTRREFLVTSTVAGACAAKSVANGPDYVYAGRGDGPATAHERTLMTLCRQCHGGCGLRVRIVDDCVVGIAGNKNHPINRGGVCARAPAALQTLYNPDRLTEPQLLAGPKGSGQYRTIPWSEAINRLGRKLIETRQAPGPHSLAVIINGDRGLARLLWSRFLQAYGSNNLIDWCGPEGHQANPAVYAQQGYKRAIGYDLRNARYVLSFDSQWLDQHWSPAQAGEALASLRHGEKDLRPRFISIEPRLSLTGAKADEWVPVRPGTEGALALGLAHVLLREGLYDREFVDELTFGLDDPADDSVGERIGFRRLVLRDYTPAKVARITGVDEGTIFRLAREFSAHKPALAIGFEGSGVSTQRTYDRMAIHALNALVGSIAVPGGVTHFENVNLITKPVPQPDAIAEQGLARPRIDEADQSTYPLGETPARQLAEHLLADLPYPIELLVMAGANPVFDGPHPERMRQALGKVPFVVSLSPWLDDSSRWADLIIPDLHFLTRWDVDLSHTLTAHPVLTIGQPVIDPPDGTLSSADLIIELARRVGPQTASALPFQNAREVVRHVCDTLAESGRGGPLGPDDEVGWIRLMESNGWRLPSTSSPGEFYQRVVETGGWSDPIHYHREWDRVFRSPRGRFSFHSSVIAQHVRPRTTAGDRRCLPHYELGSGNGEIDPGFPLRLYLYPLSVLAGVTDVNVPWLMDISGTYMRQRWRSWVEINPVTAEHNHIADGDRVIITSPRGAMTLTAKLFEGIMPEVIAIPWGLGHESGGRWTDGVGLNPAELVDVEIDPLTAGALWKSTRVSIRRA